MGTEVAAPDTRNRPITAAYVIRHKGQYVLRTAIDTYARYNTTASASVDNTNRYPGTLSRTMGGPANPASATTVASANQIAPRSATGTPSAVPKRLK